MSRALIFLWILVVASAFGCAAELGFDSDTIVSCSRAASACPGNTVCDFELGLCVSEDGPPPAAPVVALGPREPGPDGRVTERMRFSLSYSDVNGDTIAVAFRVCDENTSECFDATVYDPADRIVTSLSAASRIQSATLEWDALEDLTSRGAALSARTVIDPSGEETIKRLLDAEPTTYRLTVTVSDPVVAEETSLSYEEIRIGNDVPIALIQEDLLDAFLSDAVVIPLLVDDTELDFTNVEVEFRDVLNREWRVPDIGLGSLDGILGVDLDGLDPDVAPPVTVLVWSSRTGPRVDPRVPQGIGNETLDVEFRARARDFPDGRAHLGAWRSVFARISNQTSPVILGLQSPKGDVIGGTAPVPVYFTVADADLDPVDVGLEFSSDAGATFRPCTEFKGAQSSGVRGLATTTTAVGGITHRFDWDPAGALLAVPNGTILRITVSDGRSEPTVFEAGVGQAIGPSTDPLNRTTITTACVVREVVLRDFDGDGSIDRFERCEDGFYLARGSGTPVVFGAPVETAAVTGVFPAGPVGTSVDSHVVFESVVTNLDGDPHLDLVTAAFGGFVTYYGNSNGTFSVGQTFPSQLRGPGDDDGNDGLAVLDLDDDGDLDFAAFGNFPDSGFTDIDLLYFSNSGTTRSDRFSDPTVAATLGQAADLVGWNENGAAYLAFLDNRTVVVNADAPTAAIQTIEQGPLLDEGTLADLDGDGLLDLVAQSSSFRAGAVAVFVAISRGAGVFEPYATYSLQQRPGAFTVTDFTGDGAPDVLVSALSAQVEALVGEVRNGAPTGRLLPAGLIASEASIFFFRTVPAAAFFGGRGLILSVGLDIGSPTLQSIGLSADERTVGFGAPVQSPGIERIDSILAPFFVDVDFDGNVDMVSSQGWFSGSPSGRLTGSGQRFGSGKQTLFARELDDVPGREVIATGFDSVLGDVLLVERSDSRTSEVLSSIAYDSEQIAPRATSGLVLCDINGDGAQDLVASPGFTRDDLFVWTGNSGPPFSFSPTPTRIVGPEGPRGLDCGDVDLDGFDDIVVADFDLISGNDQTIRVYRSTPGGGTPFSLVSSFDTGQTNRLILAELNGDGVLDLIDQASDLTFFVGNGDGTFSAADDYAFAYRSVAASRSRSVAKGRDR